MRTPTLSPVEEGITLAFVQWLESAIIGTIAEDLEVVSGNDKGEPADPYLGVFVRVASGKQGITRAFELTLAIMAEESEWLPDDAEDILDAVHDVLSTPIDPSPDTGTEAFSALLAELADMADDGSIPSFFKIRSISEAVSPRLGNHAPDFERKIYTGSVAL